MSNKQIGPSFFGELQAYGGLVGQHFTWSSDGTIEFFEDTPKSVIDGVNAVYVAHDPNSVEWAKSQQVSALSAACAGAITSGFPSSASGSTCTYPSSLTDQSNQRSIASSPNGGELWCESGGVWTYKTHTQTQAQAVVASFAIWLNACQAQLVTLNAQVSAATSVDSVKAVAWTNPTIA